MDQETHRLIEIMMNTAHTNTCILAALLYVLNEKQILSKADFDQVIAIAHNSADGDIAEQIKGFGRDVGGLLK